MGPPDVAQVAGKSGRRGTGCRVFVYTTRRKWITRVKKLRRFGVSKEDGYQSRIVHENSTGIQLVLHRGKCGARIQDQYQVIGHAMGKRRRKAGVKIILRITE